MNKQVPGVGKILVMAGFALSCFGLLLFLWLAFGGPTPLKPKGYQIKVAFSEATQLAKEADVRISGVPVGKVREIFTNQDTGRTDATIEIDSDYAPVSKDARAMLRQKTLLGETYVELTPGTPDAPKVPENGRLATGQVAESVELDEIFRALDPETRQAFQTWQQTLAMAIDGRSRDLSDALGNLGPFAVDTTKVLKILNSQKPAVRQAVRNTGVVFDALSERDDQLAQLITNSNRVFAATAQRDEELADTFRALPTFERESRITMERLAEFSRNANPVVEDLRPAARELSPTLVSLGELAPDLRALFRDLDPVITLSRTALPAVQEFMTELRPFIAEFDPFLKQLNPIVDGASLYKNEITAFFANSTAATQATAPTPASPEEPVHYLRTTNPLNPETLAQYPARIGTNRTNPYQLPGASLNLKEGLLSFETRHCGRSTVFGIAEGFTDLLPESLRNRVLRFALNGGNVAAPPCKQQPRYDIQGKVTRYPQVGPDADGLEVGLPVP